MDIGKITPPPLETSQQSQRKINRSKQSSRQTGINKQHTPPKPAESAGSATAKAVGSGQVLAELRAVMRAASRASAFPMLDQDQSGGISINELETAAAEAEAADRDASHLKKLIEHHQQVDRNDSDEVEPQEIMRTPPGHKSRMARAAQLAHKLKGFEALDQDHSGSISEQELEQAKSAADAQGRPAPALEHLLKNYAAADSNFDNELGIREFLKKI